VISIEEEALKPHQGGMTMDYVIGIGWPVTLIAAFIAGLLVYRKNAKKFQALEAQARAKGKSIEDIIKG
jgi:hypothetical protein